MLARGAHLLGDDGEKGREYPSQIYAKINQVNHDGRWDLGGGI